MPTLQETTPVLPGTASSKLVGLLDTEDVNLPVAADTPENIERLVQLSYLATDRLTRLMTYTDENFNTIKTNMDLLNTVVTALGNCKFQSVSDSGTVELNPGTYNFEVISLTGTASTIAVTFPTGIGTDEVRPYGVAFLASGAARTVNVAAWPATVKHNQTANLSISSGAYGLFWGWCNDTNLYLMVVEPAVVSTVGTIEGNASAGPTTLSGETDLATTTFTTKAVPYLVIGKSYFSWANVGGSLEPNAKMQLYEDSTLLDASITHVEQTNITTEYEQVLVTMAVRTPTAASHTYKITGTPTNPTSNWTATNNVISVLECQ